MNALQKCHKIVWDQIKIIQNPGKLNQQQSNQVKSISVKLESKPIVNHTVVNIKTAVWQIRQIYLSGKLGNF